MASNPEKIIEKGIMEWLAMNNIYCQKVQSGSSFGSHNGKTWRIKFADKGTPDLFACVNGSFLAIEVKKDDKEVAKWMKLFERHESGEVLPKSYGRELDQFIQRDKIIKAGGQYIVCSSIDELADDIQQLYPQKYANS